MQRLGPIAVVGYVIIGPRRCIKAGLLRNNQILLNIGMASG